MTAASNDEGAFVDWNKCPFHSTHSWTSLCAGDRVSVNNNANKSSLNAATLFVTSRCSSGSSHGETWRGIIRGHICTRLSARNPRCLSVWKFLEIHLKREILFTPKFFSAPLRRTPMGKIKYFVNTNTDVKLGWSSSCSFFFFASIPPSQAASHLDKNKQTKKALGGELLNQLITKKTHPRRRTYSPKQANRGHCRPFSQREQSQESIQCLAGVSSFSLCFSPSLSLWWAETKTDASRCTLVEMQVVSVTKCESVLCYTAEREREREKKLNKVALWGFCREK